MIYDNCNLVDVGLHDHCRFPAQNEKLRTKKKLVQIECYICDKTFRPKGRFERFCEGCREESELLRYYS